VSELKDRYFRTLGIEPNAEEREKALERAYSQRTFEIEHYWKRATYFWGYQIAIFAAFGLLWKGETVNEWNVITLALSVLGILTALAHSLSARGSKFWQENWEHHIDMLEDSVEGRLYKTVWLSDGKIGFSVSRINRRLTDYLVIFWLTIASYVAWKFVGSPPPADLIRCIFTPPFSLPLVIMIVLVAASFLFAATSDPRGTFPTVEGCHGEPVRHRSFWTRRVCKSKARTFIRRYAPDEG
jgi:hypothetical protein